MNGEAAMAALPEAPAPDAPLDPPSRPGRSALGRALGTVVFFAVAGPLVGGLVTGFRDILDAMFAGGGFGSIVYFLVAFVSVGVPAAYAMALVPAAIVGAVFAAIDFGRRRSDPWLAVVIGALGGVLWPVPWGSGPSTLSSPFEVRIFVASIVSTLLCWFLSTRAWRRREEMPS